MKSLFTFFLFLGFGLPLIAQTYHTIPMDGTTSGWLTDESFTNCSSADNAYFTWDANYIYFGIKDDNADYGNMATFMYFDTDPTGNSGTTNAYAWGGTDNFVTVPFKADYAIVWKNKSGEDYIEVLKWNNGSNQWEKVSSTNTTSLNDGNYVVQFDIGTDYREVKVKRSTIGNPVTMKFCSFTEQQWSNYYRYFAWPGNDWTDQNRGSNQSIPHYYGFILTQHISPNALNYFDAWMYGWTGGTDNNWNTASNWAGNSIPAAKGLVTITSGSPVIDNGISSPAVCYDLSISDGASLSVPPKKAITIGNTFTNYSTTGTNVIVQSDQTGNGSLIVQKAAMGAVTVQRYVAAYTSDDNGWHEIGCPVSSMTIDGSDFVPNSGYDLYMWDETNNIWSNYKQSDASHPFTQFTAGQGYLVAYDNNSNPTKAFKGELLTNNILFNNLSYTTGGQYSGFHLLGNPYPCALNWKDTHWGRNNVGGVAQIWDETSGGYKPIVSAPNTTGDTIIPSTNGFFVQVTDATNALTIPTEARVHSTTNNYKRAEANKPKETLKFTITDDANSYKDESTLGFRSDATEKWDIAFDAHKLMSLVNAAPQIWTVSNGENFVINYLPEITKPYDVPLDFHAGVNTLYHLSVQGINSFNNPHFVLEDTRTGDMINLSQQSRYDFSAAKGDDIHRFVLHINGVTAVPQQKNNSGIHIFAYRKTVVIEGNKNLNGNVSVFDLMGRKVFTAPLNETNKQTFRLAQQTGIYFIKVEGTQGVTTKKIFIR